MKRWVAAMTLVLFAIFVGAVMADYCDDTPNDCQPYSCLLCLDNCTVQPVLDGPKPPPPDPLPKPSYEAEPIQSLVHFEIEPDLMPPRV